MKILNKMASVIFSLLFVLFAMILVSHAGEEPPQTAEQKQTGLTGAWGGRRVNLEEKGLLFEGTYTGDFMANLSGGLKQKSAYVGDMDLELTVDAEKLIGWKGTTFYFYGFGNNGGAPSTDNVGDWQGVSFYEGPIYTWTMNDAWIEKKLFNDRVSVLAGLYDLSDEFDVIDSARIFLNSSHYVNPTISLSGKNGASIYPYTSYGGRIKLQATEALYLQTAVLDGVPGRPVFGSADGKLVASEIAFVTGAEENSTTPYAKYALGKWEYTTVFDDIAETDNNGNPVKRNGSSGIYGLMEQSVYHEKQNPEQGLTFFFRMGASDPDMNQLDLYMGGGLVYTGPFGGRGEDKLGFAIASLHNSRKYTSAQVDAGTPVDASEKNIELTYHAQITPWLAVQPDFQYVVNPGTDTSVKDAVVLGSRFEISF